ncbi:phosphoglycolate phosphatase [Xylophilus rhododendri]|uniref:phosphoglycolate phosphatase n=1 Tax=Xylophilus rhododendri TaxID=2697032 RepID=A0A857JA95_9BURK|nr:phosphoglycolate phosphatase [Xylophilus rhododendri]QHI99959.1 phosphoglycolate phosphatase [Xylophilus rhododendri]
MFGNLHAVLFDLDGTLIDSAPDLGGAADAMRLARGLPSLPLDRYRPMCGAGARGMLAVAFGMAPEHADFATMREEFFQRYEQRMTENTQIFDGVAEMVEALAQRGLAWGIVTNKSQRFTGPLLGTVSALAGAATAISGDTTPHAKPHPAPLLEACRRMDVDPARCIYVGDDERDIVAGRAAGMGTVAAAWGYLGSATAIEDWGAHAIAKSPAQLLKLLDAA